MSRLPISRNFKIALGIILVLAIGTSTLSKDSPTWHPKVELKAENTRSIDKFGGSVSADGNTIAIGANQKTEADADGSEYSVGAVYVFTHSNGKWTQQSKLLANDRQSSPLINSFGRVVALQGNQLAVVAHDSQRGQKVVYIFQRTDSAWCKEAEIVSPEATAYRFADGGIALDENILVVGAVGAAYVYERDLAASKWLFQTKLIAPNYDSEGANHSGLNMGPAAAIDDDTIVVGSDAYGKSAHVFIRDRATKQWQYQTALLSIAPQAANGFGHAVAIEDNTIIVGASSESLLGLNTPGATGAIYVFERHPQTGTWNQRQRIIPQCQRVLITEECGIGASVAIRGDRFIVAGRGISFPGSTPTSAAYLFKRDSPQGLWQQETVIRPQQKSSGQASWSIESVSIGDQFAVIGNSAARNGIAYPIELPN